MLSLSPTCTLGMVTSRVWGVFCVRDRIGTKDSHPSTHPCSLYWSVSFCCSLDNLCVATLDSDHEWASFVHWVVAATITAEERGITQENAKTMPIVELFGSDLQSMFQNVVSSIGNYGEIYARNLEQILPRSGPNRLNRNPQSLLSTYVPPGLFWIVTFPWSYASNPVFVSIPSLKQKETTL